MARTLYLFSGLTPNIKGHPFFNIKVFSNYLNYLTENYTLEKQINDDNYRINTGLIRISLNNYTGNKTLTYAVEVDSENAETYHKCYFIDNITEQSGMLYLDTSIDYWGTYYLSNNIEHLHVTRCNRNIGIGIYDEIDNVLNNPTSSSVVRIDGDAFDNLYQVALVVQISYNTKQPTWLVQEQIASAGLYYIRLNDFTPVASTFSCLFEKVKEFVNGIYGVTSTRIIFPTTNDAVCTKAWLIPYSLIDDTGTIGSVSIKSKYIEGSTTKDITMNAIQLTPHVKSYSIDFTYDLNYDYIMGTPYTAGIKLAKLTKYKIGSTFYENLQNVIYISKVSLGNLKIFVNSGEDEKDITDAFEIEITGKTDATNASRAIAENVKLLNSTIRSATKGLETGGTFGAVLGGASEIAKHIPSFNAQNNINGTGGALETFDIFEQIARGGTYVRKPYAVMRYKSIINEKEHARYLGALFNEYIDDINDIFDFNLLGEGDYNLTYLVADDIKLNNLPSIARNSIENSIKSGVELIDYEGSTGE